MRSSLARSVSLILMTALVLAGCGGDVQATGCFQHRDLEESGRIGLELDNTCNTRGYCTIKVAYECGGTEQPVLAEQFDVEPLATTVHWVDVDCTQAWSYVKRWLCTEEGYPEIEDPSL
jgi:hypothetical protein